MTQELATVRATQEGRRSYIIAGLLILALAAGLRFWQIGSFSLWEDELYSVSTATQSQAWYNSWGVGKSLGVLQPNDGFWTWKLSDPHPPLYEILLAIWISLFGTSEFALRSMSALFGLLVIMSAFALPAVIPRRSSMVYALLLACSGPLVIYSQDARNYSMGVALVAWMLVLALRHWGNQAARVQAGRPPYGLLALSALLMLTHFYGVVMVFSFAMVMTLQTSGWRAFLRSSAWWLLTLVPVTTYVILGWEGIATKMDAGPVKALSFAMTFKRNLVELFHNFYPNTHATTAEFWIYLFLIALLMLSFKATKTKNLGLRQLVCYTACVQLIFFCMLVLGTRRAEFFSSRYIIFMVPGVLFFVSTLAVFSRWSRWLCAVLVLSLVLSGLWIWRASPRPQNWGEWRGASVKVVQTFQSGDVIVLGAIAPFIKNYYLYYVRKFMPSVDLEPVVWEFGMNEEAGEKIQRIMKLRPPKLIFYSYMGETHSNLDKIIKNMEMRWPCRFSGWGDYGALRVGVMSCNHKISDIQ